MYTSAVAFDEPYDFDSVLHYAMYDFAKDPTVWTIRPKAEYSNKQIGQRIKLSEVDIRKINKMYKCNQASTTPSPDLISKGDES